MLLWNFYVKYVLKDFYYLGFLKGNITESYLDQYSKEPFLVLLVIILMMNLVLIMLKVLCQFLEKTELWRCWLFSPTVCCLSWENTLFCVLGSGVQGLELPDNYKIIQFYLHFIRLLSLLFCTITITRMSMAY